MAPMEPAVPTPSSSSSPTTSWAMAASTPERIRSKRNLLFCHLHFVLLRSKKRRLVSNYSKQGKFLKPLLEKSSQPSVAFDICGYLMENFCSFVKKVKEIYPFRFLARSSTYFDRSRENFKKNFSPQISYHHMPRRKEKKTTCLSLDSNHGQFSIVALWPRGPYEVRSTDWATALWQS